MNRLALAALIALCAALPARALAVDVLTYHNDNLRSGWNDAETTLTPKTVSRGMKTLFVRDLGGLGYGQPLVVTAEATAQGTRDLVIVGNDQDVISAFDAHTGAIVWTHTARSPRVNPSLCRPLPAASICCTPASQVRRSSIGRATPSTSSPRPSSSIGIVAAASLSPVLALARPPARTEAPRADPRVRRRQGPAVRSLSDYQQQRAALLLANNHVYVGFGSTCDFNGNYYHGWLFAYDPDSLRQVATFMDSPTPDQNGNFMGGIWMSGNGSAVDAHGNLMLVTGNGKFDGQTSFGDSAIKLTPDLSRVIDYFTPYTVSSDNDADADFGSGGLLLFPDRAGSPSLAFGQGKDGILTMLDQNHLGHFTPGGPDRVLGELTLGGVWSSPAYFASGDGEYVFATGGPMYAVSVSRSPAHMHVVAQTNEQFYMNNGTGETPSISSNGSDPSSGHRLDRATGNSSTRSLSLLAYPAFDLSHPIFQAPLGAWRFQQTNSIQVPTIANGNVYVAGYTARIRWSCSGLEIASHPLLTDRDIFLNVAC